MPKIGILKGCFGVYLCFNFGSNLISFFYQNKFKNYEKIILFFSYFSITVLLLVPFACDKSSIEPEVSVKLNSNARVEENEKTLAQQIAEDKDFIDFAYTTILINRKLVESYLNTIYAIDDAKKKSLLRKVKEGDKDAFPKPNFDEKEVKNERKKQLKLFKEIYKKFPYFKTSTADEHKLLFQKAISILNPHAQSQYLNGRVEDAFVCTVEYMMCMAAAEFEYSIMVMICAMFDADPNGPCMRNAEGVRNELQHGCYEQLMLCLADYYAITP